MTALRVAKESLPTYAHPNAPKTYTQPQLFACLVLKRFYDLSYRRLWAMLNDWPSMVEWLGLSKVPHWTTLCDAHKRLLKAQPHRDLLDTTVEWGLGQRDTVAFAAVDSTGMRADRESRYYGRRRAKTAGKQGSFRKTRYPKLGLVVDTASHLILSMHAGRGPRPDVDELAGLLDHVPPGVRLHHLLADAGYDSEFNHERCRLDHGILTTIPAKIGRPSEKPPAGYYRRLMACTLEHRDWYGQRWQVETVNGMIKQNQSDVVLGHTAVSRRYEMRLAVLTHNIAVVLMVRVLYRAGQVRMPLT